jgi:hypothetical protein
MATTTNYGWTTPDDTALVKDGAAAIRSLGTAIDTSFAADEGDLLVGGTSDIFEALPIGAAGTVLTSDGDTAEWAAPAGGGQVWSLITSGSTTSGAALSFTSLSGYDSYALHWIGITLSTNDSIFPIDINGTQSSYTRTGWMATTQQASASSGSMFPAIDLDTAAVSHIFLTISGCKSATDFKKYNGNFYSGANVKGGLVDGIAGITAAVTSLNFTASSGTFTAGTYRLYGGN